MNKYKVVCKCGHVGRNNYIKIAFPVVAESKKEAAVIGRRIPRVKHHHKDAVLGVSEITDEEYMMLIDVNHNDPYLKCKNIQEQNQIDIINRLIPETKYNLREDYKEDKVIIYKKHIVKNPKKFFKDIAMMEKFKVEGTLWKKYY